MKHALVITHIGSGGTLLCRLLSTSFNIRCYGRTGVTYDHPAIVARARIRINKMLGLRGREENDWYVDKLLHNYEFTCKSFYNVFKFIFMVRNPLVPLATLISMGYRSKSAENYYLFRLRRMCEMARKTNGILLTYEDLVSKKAFPLLQNLFKLKSPLSDEFSSFYFDDENLKSGKILKNPVEPSAEIPQDVFNRCVKGYKRYLNFMETKTNLIRFVV